MILVRIFRAFGILLHHHTPETLLAGFFALCSGLCFIFYSKLLGCIGLVGAYFLYLSLLAMGEKFCNAVEPYGSCDKLEESMKLGSPPQICRGELDCATDGFFRDRDKRVVFLRGVNVSGSSKFPVNCGTHETAGFFDNENVSFVGRPFPLDTADEHFSRIQACGLTFVRLLVPWEAIEHKGPGCYDQEYLDYIREIVRIGKRHHISFLIDPHQDVWSRWTGGDGAPSWTLQVVGFDIAQLHASGAAFTHQGHILENGTDVPFPRMTWPSNHHRLAAATMFTIFFGGNDFCPKLKVCGEHAQDYLQRHYFDAFAKLAETLASEENVIGFDTLNEPNLGFIGYPDLAKESIFLRQGPSPTFFESFQLGDGNSVSVRHYCPTLVHDGLTTLNLHHKRAWSHHCLWEQHGVWGKDTLSNPVLLQHDYFRFILPLSTCIFFIPARL